MAADAPDWPQDAVEVGFVLGAWGVKGGFKAKPFAPDPQALFATRHWFLRPAADAARPVRPGTALPPVLTVTQPRVQGDLIVAQAAEVADRDAAEALRGARIFVSRKSFPAAQAGEYYWVDLIGLNVVNREGIALGTVVDLIDTGPHSVLRVRATDADEAVTEERLIPFVAAYVDAVDLAARRITVDWGVDY